ncbi:protein kinase [Penicillium alfredii]|uniref:Protein kinase n=1 Tax=Penicillium alfredii TaxID=1506179 RepID=A0A9W9KCR2_9EURO|nr:protein kinase [Penicillium alfredii]KAJ5101549.1 protein kinase [Penicillium alfredii]
MATLIISWYKNSEPTCCLKVYVTDPNRHHERELDIYKHMNSVETRHPGTNFIRKLLDHFDIQGPHGQHVCLVHEPLGTSADFLVKMARTQMAYLMTGSIWRNCSAFWDKSGNWKGVPPIPDITLESLTEKVQREDNEGVLRWLRMALQWNLEDRPTALELLYDEWLMKELGE